jgi:hypothetical protein
MSIKVTSWALNDAPVEDPVLVLVLVAMAERANDDGTTTYQSVETIARKARISVRTCQRKLRELEDAGLIRRGNQDFTAHLKAGHRPVVYDLAVHLNRGANLAPHDVSGVPTAHEWGAKSGTSGVPRLADESSFDSSRESSVHLFEVPPVVKAKKKVSTGAPDNFHISNDMEVWVMSKVPALTRTTESETAKFLSYHKAKGTKFVDWEAAWRNWMLKANEYVQRGVPPQVATALAHNGRRLNINYDEPDTGDATGYSTSTR